MPIRAKITSPIRVNDSYTMIAIALDEDTILKILDMQNKVHDKKNRRLEIEIREKGEKRSLAANRYMWSLCADIAKELSKDYKHTKEDVYRKAVREGTTFYQAHIPTAEIEKRTRMWVSGKVGRFVDNMGESPKYKGYTLVHNYYGSSDYDSIEMYYLIKRLKEDAQELGIDTMTEKEIKQLADDWKPEEG